MLQLPEYAEVHAAQDGQDEEDDEEDAQERHLKLRQEGPA